MKLRRGQMKLRNSVTASTKIRIILHLTSSNSSLQGIVQASKIA